MVSDNPQTAVLTPKPAVNRIVRRGSLKDLAYQEIRLLLVSGRLNPDRLYSAQHFAEILGVSRTPVREALLHLANEGFLVCREVKGFQIKEFSLKEIQDVLETRQVIETYVVQQVAGCLNATDMRYLGECHRQMRAYAAAEDGTNFIEADQNFHMALIRRCGNQHLLAIMENIRNRIALFGLKALGRQRNFEEVIQEHAAILSALGGTDKQQADQAMRRHLVATEQRLLEEEKLRPNPSGSADSPPTRR